MLVAVLLPTERLIAAWEKYEGGRKPRGARQTQSACPASGSKTGLRKSARMASPVFQTSQSNLIPKTETSFCQLQKRFLGRLTALPSSPQSKTTRLVLLAARATQSIFL